jgi:hypothetical protein
MCVRNRIAAIFRKIFPYGYKREFKGLFHIAWPIVSTDEPHFKRIKMITLNRLLKKSHKPCTILYMVTTT